MGVKTRTFLVSSIFLIAAVMICGALVIIPVNNSQFIARKITWGTLLTNPAFDPITLVNYLFNILMFVPIGFISMFFYSKLLGNKHAVLFTFVFSIALSIYFELSQLLLSYRVTDLDDFILNSAGAAVGIIIFQVYALSNEQNKLINRTFKNSVN